jgi:hypothetical protein
MVKADQKYLEVSRVSTGLASVFLFTKSFANWLCVEIAQICCGGVLRCISLGSTEGICSWNVKSLINGQPVVVPVGRSTLGRIFNVLGASVDHYMELSMESCFSKVYYEIGSVNREAEAPKSFSHSECNSLSCKPANVWSSTKSQNNIIASAATTLGQLGNMSYFIISYSMLTCASSPHRFDSYLVFSNKPIVKSCSFNLGLLEEEGLTTHSPANEPKLVAAVAYFKKQSELIAEPKTNLKDR